MDQLKLFIELTRIKKPIGFMLLFWPCAWGLIIGYDFENEKITFFYYLVLFFLGSILMRSAGCIVNDIVDKNYDKKVLRTRNRPIASGKISTSLGIIYAFILCFLSLLILVQFNYQTIILAMFSMPLAFIYPFMKRLTYWPQLFLGITFNYGIILGWVSANNEINPLIFIAYLGTIFWTLGYDTIYGFQDVVDDEIIGLKSTSIKFKNSPKLFLMIAYILFFFSLIITGYVFSVINLFFIVTLTIVFFHLFILQIKNLKVDDSASCLKIFKSNNFLGFIVAIGFFLGKF